MQSPVKNPGMFYIGGSWVPPSSGQFEEIINPSDETIVGRAPVGNLDDTDAAIAAARATFDQGDWAAMPVLARQALLTRLLDAVEARKREFVDVVIDEAGTLPLQAEYVFYGLGMKLARKTVTLMTRDPVTAYPPELIPQANGTTWLGAAMTVREPVGVVAAFTAYNAPFFLNLAKIIPALAAGCTVVLKPSPFTPFTALMFGEIADEIGLPAGVLNIVCGGADVGEKMTTDPRVDMVTFTGSDKIGSIILAQAAPTMKRVVLELGGKSAMIVRPDADLAAAAASAVGGFTLHCGQGCALMTRHIVHNSIRAEFVSRVAALAKAVKVGPTRDQGIGMGPLIRAQARSRTEEYVQGALDEGATLVAGGQRPAGLDKGFFFEPTLFDNVRNDFRIARDEIFGPVGVVIGYDDDSEAISIANDSEYGLAASVFSRDAGKAHQIGLKLRSGGVSINGGSGSMPTEAPFGGIKRSGLGTEYGLHGLNEFTYLKTVTFHAG